MKKILVFLIVLFSAATAVVAQAHNHNPEKFIEKMTEKLELTSEQQAQFRAFVNEKKQYKQERKAKKDNPEKKQSGPLSDVLNKKSITVNDINEAMTLAHQKRLKRKEQVIASFVNFYNSLSSEQQEKLKPFAHKMLLSKKKRKGKGKGKNKDKSKETK